MHVCRRNKDCRYSHTFLKSGENSKSPEDLKFTPKSNNFRCNAAIHITMALDCFLAANSHKQQSMSHQAFIKESSGICLEVIVQLSRIYQARSHQVVATLHRGAFFQFSFWWIHYYGSNKSTRLEIGKSHLCASVGCIC